MNARINPAARPFLPIAGALPSRSVRRARASYPIAMAMAIRVASAHRRSTIRPPYHLTTIGLTVHGASVIGPDRLNDRAADRHGGRSSHRQRNQLTSQ